MRRCVILFAVVALALTGCESLSWPPWEPAPQPPDDLYGDVQEEDLLEPAPEPGLKMSPETRFSDIPLPVDLKFDDRTYVYQSATLRIGRMVYTTRSDVTELVQFFRREFQKVGWQLETVVQADGAELAFRKGGEQLAVRIRDLGVARGCEIEMHLTPAQ